MTLCGEREESESGRSRSAFPLYSSSSTRLVSIRDSSWYLLLNVTSSDCRPLIGQRVAGRVMSRPTQESNPAFLNTNNIVTEIGFSAIALCETERHIQQQEGRKEARKERKEGKERKEVCVTEKHIQHVHHRLHVQLFMCLCREQNKVTAV